MPLLPSISMGICVEMGVVFNWKISQAGQGYAVRDPSDSAEIAFPFQKKNRLVLQHFNHTADVKPIVLMVFEFEQ